jgi:hypothetical protein
MALLDNPPLIKIIKDEEFDPHDNSKNKDPNKKEIGEI